MSVQRKIAHEPPTLRDLDGLPPGWKGEIIDGVLYTQPRPTAEHQNAILGAGEGLRGPMQRGSGGPGGWWILVEPGVRVSGAPEFSPDLAGWKKDRVPRLPSIIDIVPDWICEVMSPGTSSYDNLIKRAFYARIGVGWLWYVNVSDRTVHVSRLQDGHWLELGVWGDDQMMRAEPFEVVEVALAEWWLPREEEGAEK